jgi:hypothetical protein
VRRTLWDRWQVVPPAVLAAVEHQLAVEHRIAQRFRRLRLIAVRLDPGRALRALLALLAPPMPVLLVPARVHPPRVLTDTSATTLTGCCTAAHAPPRH